MFAIIIENYVRRTEQIDIINLLNMASALITNKLKIELTHRKLQKYISLIICFAIFNILLTGMSLFVQANSKVKYELMLYIVPFTTKCLFLSLRLSYIFSLKFNVELVNDRLNKVQRNISIGLAEERFEHDLKYYRKFHTIVWKISMLFNRWIFWTLSFEMICDGFLFVCSIFWCLLYFADVGLVDDIGLANGIIWVVISLLEILQISVACNSVTHQVRLI